MGGGFFFGYVFDRFVPHLNLLRKTVIVCLEMNMDAQPVLDVLLLGEM